MRGCCPLPIGRAARNLPSLRRPCNRDSVKPWLRDLHDPEWQWNRALGADGTPGHAERVFDRTAVEGPCSVSDQSERTRRDGRRFRSTSTEPTTDRLPPAIADRVHIAASPITRPAAPGDRRRQDSAAGVGRTVSAHALAFTPCVHPRPRRSGPPPSPAHHHPPPLLRHERLHELPRARSRARSRDLPDLRVPTLPRLRLAGPRSTCIGAWLADRPSSGGTRRSPPNRDGSGVVRRPAGPIDS